MAPKKTADSSAARKNRLANDTVDNGLIDAIVATWDFATTMEGVHIEGSKDVLSENLLEGYRLKDASPSTWSEYLKHPLWKKFPKRRPKEEDQPEAVKYSLLIYFGESNRATKNASDYWRAVKELECNALGPPQIAEEIVKGPARVRELCNLYAKRGQAKNPTGRHAKGEEQSLEIDIAPVAGTAADEFIDASARRANKIAQRAVVLTLPLGFDDLGSIASGGRYNLKFEVVSGGDRNFEIKPIKLKAATAKAPRPDTDER